MNDTTRCVSPSDSPSLSAAEASPTVSRAYQCHHCGKPIFLRNSVCLNCGSAVGYEPFRRTIVTLAPVPGDEGAGWEVEGEPGSRVARCNNLETAAGCNWLIAANEDGSFGGPHLYPGFCLACSLNRTIPDQSLARNQELWRKLELAKRRLVSQLLALALPVETRLERPDGLAFDMLENTQAGRIFTGHDAGLITLNIEEADDAARENLRVQMREPYRTLLGHFRHEIGHYYWERLVRDSAWLAGFRALFGDERADYGAALQQHYANGPPGDWQLRFVSGYGAAHPWEDWAETWAHYMHIADTVDTAISFGIDTARVELVTDPFAPADLWQPEHEGAASFLLFINGWVRLTNVLNELARSMGQPDYYPFILPGAAVAKLQFIHELIRAYSLDAAQFDVSGAAPEPDGNWDPPFSDKPSSDGPAEPSAPGAQIEACAPAASLVGQGVVAAGANIAGAGDVTQIDNVAQPANPVHLDDPTHAEDAPPVARQPGNVMQNQDGARQQSASLSDPLGDPLGDPLSGPLGDPTREPQAADAAATRIA